MAQDTQRVPAERWCDIDTAMAFVVKELRRTRRLSPESEPRVIGLMERFGSFEVRAFGVRHLGDVAAEHVEAFVWSATVRGRARPSVATMRLRRSAVRLLFRTARELCLVTSDPTIDLVLPARTNGAARPLTEAEVEACRRSARQDLVSTRLPAAWALGEATARTSEIPRVTLADADHEMGRVWIPGSHTTEPRWGTLTPWGVDQVKRRIRELGPDVAPSVSLAYRGSGTAESRRWLSAQAIRETLERAGISRPDVRPASLAAWAGSRVLHQTGRIDAVARALGVRSLDAAARIVGWDWHTDEPLDHG